MGRITSNVGLITGIPIADTVEQLIQVASAPRNILQARTQGLESEQVAINTLATRLVGLQFDLGKLAVSDPFQAKTVTSQDEDVLTATLATTGKPPAGNYQIRPAQLASSQQLISQRFEDLDDIQSTGTLSFGFGGFVNKGISLDELNDGAGVSRGEIKVTDVGGNTATIDLSTVRTVDDVVEAINDDTTTNLLASVSGDSFVLTDTTQVSGTITIQEVGSGTTAADLGLAGTFTSTSEVTGSDVFRLHSNTKLTRLNDGNGVRITDDLTDVDDITITLDAVSFGVDLSGSSTLGDIVTAINADADNVGQVIAAISSDGNRLEINDTTGATTFEISNGVLGTAADDLGLTETASGSVITGGRLVSGLNDTLLSSLNGGAGVDTSVALDITNRGGVNSLVDISSAETISDVVAAINSQATDVTAEINSARNGVTLTDTTGLTVSNLVVATSVTADALGLTADVDADSINSGSLSRQTLSEATTLSSLGITASDIRITDTNGQTTSVDLNPSGNEAQTIGDVIDAINASGAAVQASINDTGDGIQIVDTAFGSATLGITDLNGTLAEKLNLTRASTTVDINGSDTQVIDGTSSYSIDLSDIDGSPESVALSSVNDGAGIDFSDIRITDSQGGTLVLDLNGKYSGVTTVGQVIDAINAEATAQGANVTASINASGTGILLTDNTGGDLTVEDINGTAAADLKILSTDTTDDTIDGIGLFSAQDASEGALESVADRINELEAGVTASTFFDGVGFRLSITVDETGSANEILLDAGDTGFAFEETSSAEDALILLGEGDTPGSGVLISSATNDFQQVIEGVDLTVASTSSTNVNVSVESASGTLVDTIEDFVDSYNSFRTELDGLTAFDEVELTTGLLFGSNEAVRVDTALSRLVTDSYFNVGSFTSLGEIGIDVDGEGKLSLDRAALEEAFESDPSSLQRFFTDENDGVVAKFNTTIDQLAGDENGFLGNSSDALQATIDSNNARIEQLNDSLDRQRERLLLEFTQLETLVASLQQNLTALEAIQPLSPLVSVG